MTTVRVKHGFPMTGISGTVPFTGTGAADDGPALQAAIFDAAQNGNWIYLSGLIKVETIVTLPLTGIPVRIRLAPNCEVRGNGVPGAIFLADSVSTGSLATTLTGPGAVYGLKSVTVASVGGLAVGNAIALINVTNNLVETHVLRRIDPITKTLYFTDLITGTFAAGASVYLLPGLANIHIIGDKGTSKITGTAEEGIQIKGGRYCLLEGLTLAVACSGSFPWPLYWDWSSRDCITRDVDVYADATNPGTTGHGLEHPINCLLDNVNFFQIDAQFGNGGGAAIETTSPVNLVIRQCSAPGSNIALVIEAPDTGSGYITEGGDGCIVDGGDFSRSNYAVIVRNAKHRNVSIRNVSAPECLIAAVYIDGAASGVYPDGVEIVGGDFSSSAIGINPLGGFDHSFINVNVALCGTGILAEGSATFKATTVNAKGCTGSNGAIGLFSTGERINLSGVDASGASYCSLFVDSSTGANTRITIDKSDFTGSGTVSGNGCAKIFGGLVTIRDTDTGWRADTAVTCNGIMVGGSADVTLENVLIFIPQSVGGTQVAMSLGSGGSTTCKTRLRRVKILTGGVTGTGGGSTYGVITNSACTVFDMGEVDLSQAGATNSWFLTPNTVLNFGTFTVNGATPVTISNVASPDPKAAFSAPTLITVGGTPAPVYQTAPLAGGSFQVASSSGNTSVYGWTYR